jgi:VWFA-related protein
MQRKPPSPRSLRLAALPLTLALFANAQPPPAAQSTAPTLHVYSRETIIDVLVTDDKGQPVRGLTRADFTVEEDSKPQPIRSFSEYDKTTPPPAPRPLPPNTYTNATTLPTTGPVQIFLFDLLGSAPDDIERSKKYIAQYLRTMPTGTQVVAFAFSHHGLHLVHDFTTNGPAAAAAVESLDVEWIHDPVMATPMAIAGMNQIADYIAGIHGRKNLVWIVQGMPLMITRDGGLPWKIGAPPDMIIVHRLMDLYDRFAKEQIAIYPLDPRGVHGLGPGALMAAEVAEATGGTTDNTNDYKSEITSIIDKTSHMYTLSYVPTRPDEDGHFHPIKITFDRPGVHLLYRSGYNDEQPHPPDLALIHDMIQGPMRLGALPSTQILFDLHIQPGSASSPAKPAEPSVSSPAIPHKKGTATYNALFTFDPTQLTLTEAPDGTRTASIELDLGAFDSFSQLVTARSQTFNITVTPAQYANFYQKPLNLSLAIDLPHGQLTLHAGLFDTVANKAGTLEIPLTIPKK